MEQLCDVCLTEDVPTYLQDRDEALITLLYNAGLRAGEVCGLDVDYLGLEAGIVYLPTTIQKGSSHQRALKIVLGNGQAPSEVPP